MKHTAADEDSEASGKDDPFSEERQEKKRVALVTKVINSQDTDEMFYRPFPLELINIKVDSGLGTSFDTIQPVVNHYHFSYPSKNITKESHVEIPRFEKVFKNFACYKDPEYNRNYHKIVNGALEEYKRVVIEIANQLENHVDKPNEHYIFRNDVSFVNHVLPKIQLGISSFDLFPICILNEKAMIEMVPGIDVKENAHFIQLILNCKKFKVEAIRDARCKNQYHFITTFDENCMFKFHQFARGRSDC